MSVFLLQPLNIRFTTSSGTSVQSLPTNLEQAVSVKENELGSHTPWGHNCSGESLGNSDLSSNGSDGRQSGDLNNIPDAKSDSIFETGDDGGMIQVIGTSPPLSDDAFSGFPKDLENLQKTATQLQAKKNRTMLIQVSQYDVSLISPDKKRVVLERKFRDISFCSQVII